MIYIHFSTINYKSTVWHECTLLLHWDSATLMGAKIWDLTKIDSHVRKKQERENSSISLTLRKLLSPFMIHEDKSDSRKSGWYKMLCGNKNIISQPRSGSYRLPKFKTYITARYENHNVYCDLRLWNRKTHIEPSQNVSGVV